MKIAGPFFFAAMAVETLEQTSPDRIAQLEAQLTPEQSAALAERFPRGAKSEPPAPALAVDDDPPEEPEPVEPEEAPETPPETPAPGATATAATATPANASPNVSAGQPASWQPNEVVRQWARSKGIPEEVVRGFRSAEEFANAVALSDLRHAQQQQPPPATQTQAPSALDKFIADDLQDPDVRAAVKEMKEQTAAMQQQLQQLSQGTQQFTQAQQQRAQAEIERIFDQQLDEFADDFLGKRATATPEQMQRRGEVFNGLAILMQHGKATEINRDSLARSLAIAFPEQFQQHLRRTQVAAAQKQAANKVGAGRTSGKPSAPPPGNPHDMRLTPDLIAAANQAGIPV